MEKTIKEPLFHIEKRDKSKFPWWKAVLIRGCAIFAAIVVCGILSLILIKENPLKICSVVFEGTFGTERRIWELLLNTSLLLGVALAIVPAFKMKFWNLGGNGQVLMGCLATTACMVCLGGKLPDGIVNILMVLSGVAAGMLWAVIPAIFKAKWKTNETLFTLMMNYIAAGLVSFFVCTWDKSGSGTLGIVKKAWLPEIGNKYLLPVILVAVLTVAMFVYLKYSKHGYELSVVGESENTARYVGVNVQKVVVRTLLISGAVCGLIGLLLSGAVNHTVNSEIVDDRGFTAILVAWLAKFNPFFMVLASFFVVFLDQGMGMVSTRFNLKSNDFSNIVVGIVFFFIIGCEFFIDYKLRAGEPMKRFFGKVKKIFKKKEKKSEPKEDVSCS